ncbi:hypothetical protein N7463_010672 [Penicillium fimorum]|uniref:Uncharacterized protein n=1 Tax=Penicillium fimorum TaxID=1882269 RepID=A0A9W9XL85_9EURO|nr:hypothetical protein N7463_010672 [Penicillium fimorum]
MSKSKSKRRNRNANQVKQIQSPPASLSPSSRVTKSGQPNNNRNKNSNSNNHRNNHRKNSSNNNSNKAKKLQHSEVFKKNGLNSESSQAGHSNCPLTNDKLPKPSFKNPQVKVQEPAESTLPPLQRAYTPKVKKAYEYVSESEFEFEYKNPTQAHAPLQSQSSFRPLPLSPPTTVGPKWARQISEHHGRKNHESPTLGLGFETGREPASLSGSTRSFPQRVVDESDCEEGEATDETSSSDEESESERENDPVSPRQSVVGFEKPTPLSGHGSQHKSRRTLLSNSIAQSQSVSISQSGLGSVLPSPASSERAMSRKEATLASYPDYGQRTRQLLTSDIDTDSEPPSEAGPDSGPEPSSPSSSSSPSLFRCRLKALKRKRSNIHNSSRHKAVPRPARSSPEGLREDDTEPMLPTEPTWSTLSPLDRPTSPEPTIQNFRTLHWRDACELKRPPSPSSSQLDLVIGPESPSKSIPASEFLPQDSEFEYRDPSPIPSMTPVSSPPVPPAVPQVVPRDITPSPPQRWLLRLQWKGQKSSLRQTIWASRLRAKCYIKGGGSPLMIDGNKYPHLFTEFPPAAHNNPEWLFPDASDDDREFESQDARFNLELPTAKRPRLGLSGNLTEREESLEREELSEAGSLDLGQLSESPHRPERLQSSESEQPSELEESPEVGTLPESELDLAPLLDLVTSSGPDRMSELERSSGAKSEQPRTPTFIRDELSTGQVRQLNKQIEEAIKRDKNDHPRHWGGSWMKEYVRGGLIKERVEVEYREKIMREKEKDAKKREREKQERDKKKKEKERKRIEEQRIQEERDAQKRKEEEQESQKQKEIQRREELKRRREKKREKAREMLQKSLSESQKRYMEDLGVEI